MEIVFKTAKLQKLCNSNKELQRKYGPQKARKILQRLDGLKAAETLADLSHLPPLRCHELKGDRDGQLAIDTIHPFRMIFEPAHHPVPLLPDGGMDKLLVTAVRILEVDLDYHD
jgi:proteic killer suppression protein